MSLHCTETRRTPTRSSVASPRPRVTQSLGVKRLLLAAVMLLLLPSAADALGGGSFEKVFIVVLENTAYEDALAQPFLRDLAASGALLTNFFAETHPSFPNYVALTAGSTFGLTSNAEVTLDVSHVGDLLERAGRTWKVYAEGYPGDCFLGTSAGAYVRRHVPFLSFANVRTDPARCRLIVDASVLAADVEHGTLPDYGLYIPDNNNNGHDTGVAFTDAWLARTFGPWLQDPRFTDGMLLVVTFDESAASTPNHVYTALLGPGVVPGSTSASRYDHVSLLRTIEDTFGLDTLGQHDAVASAITGVWRRTLTVASVNPGGVAMTVNPVDEEGLGSGTSPFTRVYRDSALVTLTAPITSQSATFRKWRQDGADVSTSPSVNVLMDGDHALTAVYGPVSFGDVPPGHAFWPWIEALYEAGITGGCGTNPPAYCPDQSVSRSQMAVFLLRGIHGAGYQPPDATGTTFEDVPESHPLAWWIDAFAREGITAGCASSPPLYCPEAAVTRGQAAVFLLRAKHGAAYQPPGAAGTFADVPPALAPWIEQLAREGVTGGCATNPSRYCPDDPVTRGQMAVFLVRAFSLPL